MNDIINIPLWRPYKLVPRDNGKLGKPPHCPKTGELLKGWNDPELHITYDEATNAIDEHNLDGIGFITSPGFFVIDIDGIEPLDHRVQAIIQAFDTYTEYSPSKMGVHIIGMVDEAQIPDDVKMSWEAPNGMKFELFLGRNRHYVTFTDEPVEMGMTLEERTPELLEFLREFGGIATPSVEPGSQSEGGAKVITSSYEDNRLLMIAFAGKYGNDVKSLFEGNLNRFNGDQSKGDLSLVNSLISASLYAMGGYDPAQIDRIFRTSQLMREKWDTVHHTDGGIKRTYGENCIQLAAANQVKRFDSKIITGGHSTCEAPAMTPKLIPADYTHVGEAVILAEHYGNFLQYSEATKFITYNGKKWEEVQARAKKAVQHLTTRQLKEAEAMLRLTAQKRKAATGGEAVTEINPELKAILDQLDREAAYANGYKKFAMQCRFNGTINGILSQVEPLILVDVSELDSDPFLLNTPRGTYDLRTGDMKKHDPGDLCTKITAVSPSDEGAEIFAAFMRTICSNDQDFIDYIQKIVGLAALGKVFHEHLIIAHGKGANGKSTLFNTIGRVLGDYFHTIPPESLLANQKGHKDYNLAEMRGRRLIIAAETEEGKRLSESSVKRISSKDPIHAEKKFKDPFKFEPSHSVILYTNFLPKVGSLDHGTWRRLVILPFRHRFTGTGDKKDYADYLYQNAGGAILQWIIEGTKKVIAANFHADPSKCVLDAINAYRADNDWIGNFIEDCCDVGAYTEKAKDLYTRYRDYAKDRGEFARSDSDLKTALEEAGYARKRMTSGWVYSGLKLKPLQLPHGGSCSGWGSYQ